MKKALVILVVLFLSIGVSLGTADAKRNFVRWGGSNPGGLYFVMVGGLSEIANQQIPNINVSNVQSAGSVGNNRLARKDEVDMWFGYGFTALESYNAKVTFKDTKPFKDIRMVSGLYTGLYHLVTLEKYKDINILADIEDKRVCMGGPGSGAAANSAYILGTLGMWDNIKRQQWSYGACGRGMLDGQSDVVTPPMAPMSFVVTVEAMKKIKYIEFTEEQMDKVIAKHPFYSKGTIKAGSYKTINKDAPALAYQVLWSAQKKMDPELVYNILKVTFDPKNRKRMLAIHPVMKQMGAKLDFLNDLKIPLHPGAVKYWKEQGLTIPPGLIPPEMK
jgi:TRAP transporter TAXI family solute receptor